MSQFQAQLVAVRAKFLQQFPSISGGWNPAGGMPVRVTGVVFFDRPHGQTGRAVNGLEIHPVLDLDFDGGVTPPPPPPPAGLVLNAGFEEGAAAPSWTATPAVISDDVREPARTGTFKAWLGGYGVPHIDTLSQPVTIPSDAVAATLSFFLHISTEEQNLQQFDFLRVRVRRANGQVTSLRTYTNLQAEAGYALQTFSLTAFRGETIRIELVSEEDNGSMTSFVVDDFSILIER